VSLLRKTRFAAVLALVLGLPLIAAAQSGKGGNSQSSGSQVDSDAAAIANIVLTGNVITSEGNPPPEPVAIERVCRGSTVRVGFTDNKGFFSFRLMDTSPTTQDASESSSGVSLDAFASQGMTPATAAGFGVAPKMLPSGFAPGLAAVTGCELRGLLAGFQSTSVLILVRDSLETVNLGTIILLKGQELGSTVSATSMAAPKAAKKAYEKANGDLQKHKLAEAQADLEHAVTLYPRYAVAWTHLGWLHQQQNRLDQALTAFTQAQAADAKYVPAYVGLASVALRQSKWADAERASAHATELDAVDFPVAFYYNAVANLELGQLDKAEDAARMAERIDSRKALPQVKPLLSDILARKQDYHGAADELKLYLQSPSATADVEKIRQRVADLEKLAASTDQKAEPKATAFLTVPAPPAADARLTTLANRDDVVKAGNSTPLVAPIREHWAPPDVDEVVPPVRPNVPCSLHKVMSAASMRIKQLMDNLQEFSATERIEHMQMDKDGDLQHSESATFKYVAQIRVVKPGQLETEEYRNGSTSQTFPASMATIGMTTHALMLHPSIIGDLEVTCEGLGSVRGKPAWQLHFVQRADRPARFREYRTPKGLFPVAMKGRAWIAADNYQVVRMETDLVKPIEKIGLRRDHVVIDYRPVEFQKRHLQLWLPETADLYQDLNGQRVHRRHSLSDFELFWVETGEKPQKLADPGPPG